MASNSTLKIFFLFILFNNFTGIGNCVIAINLPGDSIDDYYSNNFLRYENYTYKKNIKSVQLHEESWELSPPVIQLGTEQKLKLSFDDLDTEQKKYMYTVIHCSASWEPSEIISNEYIDGFTDITINTYQYSFNTLQRYIHYNAVFPNESMKFTKSGNYLVKVYEDADPNNLVITKRFMVFENRVQIEQRVNAATVVEDRNYKQEVDFTILYNNYTIRDPYSDLKVVLTQNDRWDNVITNLKPLYVKDKELVYDYDRDNVFPGGNEFRTFDIKSLKFQSERIKDITYDSLKTHVYLLSDEKRSYKRFNSMSDINGKYLIKIQDSKNTEIEADYVYVHFFLPYEATITDGNLYVFGALTDWRCDKQNQLMYNYKRMGYEGKLYLKQGYYNFEYVIMNDGSKIADETLIEGSHYETENDYSIYVYHRANGTFYDQLIAVKRFNTFRR